MALLDLIGQGGPVLQLIKNYLTQPTVAFVAIQATRFETTMEADVSKKVIIDLTRGKHIVNDNVAPGPRTWEVEGFVGGMPGELSSYFMPSLVIFTAMLEAAYLSRQQVPLKDPSGRMFQVVISRFWYSTQPEVQNRVPVRLTLQEIYTLSVLTLAANALPSATPLDGSLSGNSLSSGVTQSLTQGEAATAALGALTLVGL